MLIGMATRRFHSLSGAAASIMMAGSGTGGALSPWLLVFFADELNLRFSVGALAVGAVIAFLLCVTMLRKVAGAEAPSFEGKT